VLEAVLGGEACEFVELGVAGAAADQFGGPGGIAGGVEDEVAADDSGGETIGAEFGGEDGVAIEAGDGDGGGDEFAIAGGDLEAGSADVGEDVAVAGVDGIDAPDGAAGAAFGDDLLDTAIQRGGPGEGRARRRTRKGRRERNGMRAASTEMTEPTG
jgi:hypothetical protein